MLSGAAHEATIVLLVLLLLEGSGLLRLGLLVLPLAFAMRLLLTHHVSTGLTRSTFRPSVFSPSFLLCLRVVAKSL